MNAHPRVPAANHGEAAWRVSIAEPDFERLRTKHASRKAAKAQRRGKAFSDPLRCTRRVFAPLRKIFSGSGAAVSVEPS
jgi:hypothetical protein